MVSEERIKIESLQKKMSEKTIASQKIQKHVLILEELLNLKSCEKDLMEYVINFDKWDCNIFDRKNRSWDIKYKRKNIYQFITDKIKCFVIERKDDDVTKEFLLCFSGFMCREIERLKKCERELED
jgi:hypothetical protein